MSRVGHGGLLVDGVVEAGPWSWSQNSFSRGTHVLCVIRLGKSFFGGRGEAWPGSGCFMMS